MFEWTWTCDEAPVTTTPFWLRPLISDPAIVTFSLRSTRTPLMPRSIFALTTATLRAPTTWISQSGGVGPTSMAAPPKSTRMSGFSTTSAVSACSRRLDTVTWAGPEVARRSLS